MKRRRKNKKKIGILIIVLFFIASAMFYDSDEKEPVQISQSSEELSGQTVEVEEAEQRLSAVLHAAKTQPRLI